MFSSTYKDSNTLHLPTERFSPVRRFSDGAASIQAFKAHLENTGTSSSIKQLQQVMGGQAWGRVAGARAQTRLLPHTLAGLLAMHSFPHERAQPSSCLCSSLVRHFRAWVPGGSSRKGPPPVTWAWGAVAAGRAPGGSKCSCRRLWGTGCPSVFLPARLQWHKLCTVVRVSHWTF